MKLVNELSFKAAQNAAREAVARGSKSGGEFDWHVAMILLRSAYGLSDD